MIMDDNAFSTDFINEEKLMNINVNEKTEAVIKDLSLKCLSIFTLA